MSIKASARIFVAATALPMRMYSLNGGQPSSPGPKVIDGMPRSAKRMVSLKAFLR
jgi:hypothetical protein